MAITTNREYLLATLSKFNLTDSDIDLIMVEHPELDETLNVRSCKVAMHQSMSAILQPVNISEGGYSVSWNIDALKLWYSALCNELGMDEAIGRPKIRNRSNYW